MSDFWDELTGGYAGAASGIDDHLGRRLEASAPSSVRAITDRGREEFALPMPAAEDTRVSFNGNVGAVLTYDDPPVNGASGTVVNVRTSMGWATGHGERIFVKFDDPDGRLLTIDRRHLKSDNFRVSSLGDLSDFFTVIGGDDREGELVHKSTEDLWSLAADGDGWMISRLKDDSEGPLEG
jgi:hypothetical protein